MDQPGFSIPLREVINFVTLIQALVFAGVLSLRPYSAARGAWFLVASLILISTVKADQLFQMLGGLEHYPEYGFLLAPFQALIAPTLYLFVVSKTDPEFKLRRGHSWHLTPLLLSLIYFIAVYYRLDAAAKATAVAGGGFSSIFSTFFVPFFSDVIQLGYVTAALTRLGRHGVSIRNWFSVVEDRDLRWLKRLIVIWGIVFAFHAVWTVSGGIFGARPFARIVLDALNLVHLAIVNALMLIGVSGARNMPSELPIRTAAIKAKYAGSALSDQDRQALYRRAATALDHDRLFLKADLTLRDLAEHIGATPREASEAINAVGEVTFFDFVNRARIAHAETLLASDNTMRILDVGLQSGFNSKTAFNDAFKKYTKMTPSNYRRRLASPPEKAQPAAN